MTNKISIKIILGVLLIVVIFHLCIIAKIIPYEMTWGGKLNSEQEMYVFECISIFIILFLGFVLLMKGGYIKSYFRQSVINIILWIFFIFFVFNTIGNMFAKTSFEKSFTVVTLIFAILIGIILKKDRQLSTD